MLYVQIAPEVRSRRFDLVVRTLRSGQNQDLRQSINRDFYSNFRGFELFCKTRPQTTPSRRYQSLVYYKINCKRDLSTVYYR